MNDSVGELVVGGYMVGSLVFEAVVVVVVIVVVVSVLPSLPWPRR